MTKQKAEQLAMAISNLINAYHLDLAMPYPGKPCENIMEAKERLVEKLQQVESK